MMKKPSLVAMSAIFVAILLFQNGGKLLNRITQEKSDSDEIFASAFSDRRGNFVAEGTGVVARVLSEDQDGSRHQRFIIELASGQTLLMSHNIDVAPRVVGLTVGDVVSLKGEYEWNDMGGVVHWTHRDPNQIHESGWIRHNGKVYQ